MQECCDVEQSATLKKGSDKGAEAPALAEQEPVAVGHVDSEQRSSKQLRKCARRKRAKKVQAHIALLAGLDVEQARKYVQDMSIEDVDSCSEQMCLLRCMRPSRRRRRLAWALAAKPELRLKGDVVLNNFSVID